MTLEAFLEVVWCHFTCNHALNRIVAIRFAACSALKGNRCYALSMNAAQDHAQDAIVETVGVLFDSVSPTAGSEATTPGVGGAAQDFLVRENSPGGGTLLRDKKSIQPIGQNTETVVQLVGELEYTPAIIDKMFAFFERYPKTRTLLETYYTKTGEVREVEKEIANTPPRFSQFARSIGVTTRRLKLWKKLHVGFAHAYEECEEIAKEFYIDNGLMGHYSSQFAIFAAKNETNMKDKTITEKHTLDVNKFLDKLERGEKYDHDEFTGT